ncbi:MAG: hypothetical protein KJ655_06395, partial [Candidatus Thermoplasmatota archaeon]|nr:hypothetical protein [Candidatus Thermoplasmatota archaeon]
ICEGDVTPALDLLAYDKHSKAAITTSNVEVRREGGTTWTTISTITHPVNTYVANNPTSYVWAFSARSGLFKAVYAPGYTDLYYGTITYAEITII